MSRTVFGIRHHGPGSARSLVRALDELEPDAVLIEGPADGTDLIELIAEEGMAPPLAILAYLDRDPARCVFYPFAAFSPEWQAMRWALEHDVPTRFIDLPAAEVLASGGDRRGGADPLQMLAQAAGYDDAERWWEDMVEHRDDHATFAAVLDAMGAVRAEHPTPQHEQRREDYMRARIHEATEDNVAVVCGAWHAPVLADTERKVRAAGNARSQKTRLTWVPWTYDRLAARSGYGAGVESPGWYEHLFDRRHDDPLGSWLARAAALLREEDADFSTAHVVEAARTADALAAVRGRPLAGLPEIGDALAAVLGEGAPGLLGLLHERLVIGERLGTVAANVPTVPLQKDLEARQRSLRLKPEPKARALDLDLRRDIDLERSRLLHRLGLLGIPWGRPTRVTGARGTFREGWALRWQPEFSVRIVDAAGWGPTVESAATARVRDRAAKAEALRDLTELLEASLLAELPDAIGAVLAHFEAHAARSSDVGALADGVPPLARAVRYGSVRRTDAEAISGVLRELVARVSVGLPAAAAGIDEDVAAALARTVDAVDAALDTVDDADLVAAWRAALARTADRGDAHPLLAGRATRLLRDAGRFDAEDAARRMDLALSRATPALQAAAWLEGFLSGSGLVVIHDATLLGLIDTWLAGAPPDAFDTVLPILRRTFSAFPAGERRQIGERVRRGVDEPAATADQDLDPDRAALVEPVLRRLLGVR